MSKMMEQDEYIDEQIKCKAFLDLVQTSDGYIVKSSCGGENIYAFDKKTKFIFVFHIFKDQISLDYLSPDSCKVIAELVTVLDGL